MLKRAKQMRQVNSTHPALEKEVVIKQLIVFKKKKKQPQNEHTTSDSKLYRFLAMPQITLQDFKKTKTKQTKIKKGTFLDS